VELLQIKNLKVTVEDTAILSGLDLSIGKGEVHVLMGPNGAGKSTLVNTIMGHPQYQVEQGTILFDGKDITRMPANNRAKAGLFLSFQNPEEVPGITLESFLRMSRVAVTGKPVRLFAFKKELREKMDELGMDTEYASRYLNVGFSGGEKKKIGNFADDDAEPQAGDSGRNRLRTGRGRGQNRLTRRGEI
jgi:Fe-S cluster assembly ATP-binding protein